MNNKESKRHRYIYGPVPSRRLGLSLGIDIVPMKICTLDCIFCQLGRTTEKSTVRRDFVDIDAVIAEVKSRLAEGVRTDYITIGGSGEPTLNSRLGDLIGGLHKVTDTPVAVLTNGTLFDREDVRAECAKADVVIPSLDAGDEAAFEAVTRPACDISIEKLVSGLSTFRDEFSGQIWLEVFIVPGVNTSPEQIAEMKGLVERIRPNKVQLNTAVRPPTEKSVEPASYETLTAIAREMGGDCEVIADVPAGSCDRQAAQVTADVLSMLKRRPCSVQDLCTGLGITPDEATRQLTDLRRQGLIVAEPRGDTVYFRGHSKPS
ncbi:MAG: radical SAM protein [Planctomycetaceae bacterium]|nr:MAG: radical SAM protein [Planctomycetaceae bacterium]